MTTRYKWIWILMTLVVLGMALTAYAGQKTKHGNMTTGSMEELVVTGTRTRQRPIDVPVNTEVITREAIAMSGATQVGDVIGKYITGHYHRYSGMLSPIGLRGFRTESHGDDIKGHVLILIDGHRVGTGNAAKINVDRVERIEVIKGPASALYGSAAMGGVINIITNKGDGPLEVKISGDYGSFEYYKVRVAGGGEIDDRFRFHATVSQEEIDDYDDPEFGQVHNSSEKRNDLGGNFVFSPTPEHELRLGGSYADLSGDSPEWENYSTYSRYDRDTRDNYDKSHGYLDLEYNGDFMNHRFHWRGVGYYLWDRNHWKWGFPDPDASQTRYTDTTWGTDHQISWTMTDWNRLLFGFTLEWLEKESEAIRNYQPSVPYTPSMEYHTQAVFIQDAMDFWDNRINVVAALRYDRFDVETHPPETGQLEYFNEKSESYDHLSPKLGMSIKFFGEMLRFRTNLGQGFKSPSPDQLSADFIHSGTRYVGNPELDPETSVTYDVGIDIYHPFFTFSAGYFHTDFKDKIVKETINLDGNPAVTWHNHGDAEIAGFDVGFNIDFGKMVDAPFGANLWSNITINTQKKDKETDEDLLYVSDYEIKSGLDVSYNGATLQLTHVWVGPQDITNYDSWPYSTETKSRFDFFDLNLRYQFLNHWQVHASVLNLFDDRVEWVRGYLMPERNYRVGVSYSF